MWAQSGSRGLRSTASRRQPIARIPALLRARTVPGTDASPASRLHRTANRAGSDADNLRRALPPAAPETVGHHDGAVRRGPGDSARHDHRNGIRLGVTEERPARPGRARRRDRSRYCAVQCGAHICHALSDRCDLRAPRRPNSQDAACHACLTRQRRAPSVRGHRDGGRHNRTGGPSCGRPPGTEIAPETARRRSLQAPRPAADRPDSRYGPAPPPMATSVHITRANIGRPGAGQRPAIWT